MKEFDYYIFIDFSENLIGYNIIEKQKLKELLPKILRFRHYKEVGNKKLYLKNIRRTIKKENIKSLLLKVEIKNCIIFISVDNRQYSAFRKMVDIVDGKNVIVKQESELVKGTPEYQASLVLDNMLNAVRLKE